MASAEHDNVGLHGGPYYVPISGNSPTAVEPDARIQPRWWLPRKALVVAGTCALGLLLAPLTPIPPVLAAFFRGRHPYRDTRVVERTPAPAFSTMPYEDWTFGIGLPEPMENATQMVHDHHSVDMLTDKRFSPHTLVSSEAMDKLRDDDKKCHRAARRPQKFDAHKCLGAPYLYVTFHGGYSDKRVKTVCKYSRDGCSWGSATFPSDLHEPHSFRGMLHEREHLLVAEAWKENSRVLRYSRCNPDLGHRRELLDVLVDATDPNSDANGMIHPYGFAKKSNADPYFYVSAQGTRTVLRFRKDDGTPATFPKGLLTLNATHSLGTFVTLGDDEVRGVAFDAQGVLYVSNKQKGVMAYDKDGFLLGILPGGAKRPISVHYCTHRNSLWVGCAKQHVIYEYDASTWQIMQEISHKKLNHPAGLLAYGDSLFVISQGSNELLQFSIATGGFEAVVLNDLQDAGERVVLSAC